MIIWSYFFNLPAFDLITLFVYSLVSCCWCYCCGCCCRNCESICPFFCLKMRLLVRLSFWARNIATVRYFLIQNFVGLFAASKSHIVLCKFTVLLKQSNAFNIKRSPKWFGVISSNLDVFRGAQQHHRFSRRLLVSKSYQQMRKSHQQLRQSYQQMRAIMILVTLMMCGKKWQLFDNIRNFFILFVMI